MSQHNNNNSLMALCPGLSSEPVSEENIHICHLLGFVVQEKITEAGSLTIWLDATPFELLVPPPPPSPPFLCQMLLLGWVGYL